MHEYKRTTNKNQITSDFYWDLVRLTLAHGAPKAFSKTLRSRLACVSSAWSKVHLLLSRAVVWMILERIGAWEYLQIVIDLTSILNRSWTVCKEEGPDVDFWLNIYSLEIPMNQKMAWVSIYGVSKVLTMVRCYRKSNRSLSFSSFKELAT